jgi:anti-sigma regulatory factor (Ser/Thr protein kinase)
LNESSTIWFDLCVLPPDLAGAGDARAFVRARLESHDLHYLLDDIRLVVSELVANAVVHGRPPVMLTLEEQPLQVLVTVSDESPALPLALPPGNVTALSGRGLSIVAMVSSAWGTNNRSDGGKSVWARFDKETRATTSTRGQAQQV